MDSGLSIQPSELVTQFEATCDPFTQGTGWKIIILEKYEVFPALFPRSRLELKGINNPVSYNKFLVDLLHIVWSARGPPLELWFKFSKRTQVLGSHIGKPGNLHS